MIPRSAFRPVVAALALLLGWFEAAPAGAANPISLCRSGQPYAWGNGGVGIPFNPDQGGLGGMTNAEAVALVEEALGKWAAVPTSTASFVNTGLLPVNVDATNFAPYFFGQPPNGLSPIIFDEHGEIAEALVGFNAGLVSMGGPAAVDPSTCEVLQGRVYLNPAATLAFPFKGIVLHELGHFAGLGHSLVNGQIFYFFDTSGPSPFNTFGPLPSRDLLEVMFGGYWGPVHRDDIAALSNLYPAAGFAATTGTITGRILAPDGTPLSGINVIARNVDNPFEDAVSGLSGNLAAPGSASDPFAGVYRLTGLTPGAHYAVYADQITYVPSEFVVEPAALPGPEEFWNGANESNDIATHDDPSQFVAVTPSAGSPVTGIDIVFNTPRPGEPLAIGDENFFQLPLSFPFEICGQTFSSLFVEANGTITFGSADRLPFARGPRDYVLPRTIRIAGFLTDLNASAGGAVTFDTTPNAFTLRWDSVPEFPAFGSNTFSISLERESNNVVLDYGALTATSGLAGITCGGAAISSFEEETDLRANPRGGTLSLNDQAAVFEEFAGDNDLSHSTVRFVDVAKGLRDAFEDNDTLAKAAPIQLPFDTADPRRFSDITPGDVDYYRFHVKAGDLLAAEIARGTFNTVLGLFDRDTGELLAVNDNGGAGFTGGVFYGFSRLLFSFDADREVALAVSAFPDFGFTGAGGRYVLTANTYRGDALTALNDDDAREVPIGFSFPFQGQTWQSVFVNTNGHLTFGAPDAFDFTESVAEFLAGPPRIAALWRDLSPFHGAKILVEHGKDSLNVHYVSMSEFLGETAGTFSTFPNYLSITLHVSGAIHVQWGATTRGQGLVGITPGGGAADPGESDVSSLRSAPATGTTYEIFTGDARSFRFGEDLSDLSFHEIWFRP